MPQPSIDIGGWEHVGNCYVDAGLIWIGDPCYVMGDDASSRVTDWSEFCDKLFACEVDNVAKPLGEGTGITVGSGYGDGEYAVYVQRSDGRIARAMIEFIGMDDYYLEDDEDPEWDHAKCGECGDYLDEVGYCPNCEPEEQF